MRKRVSPLNGYRFRRASERHIFGSSTPTGGEVEREERGGFNWVLSLDVTAVRRFGG